MGMVRAKAQNRLLSFLLLVLCAVLISASDAPAAQPVIKDVVLIEGIKVRQMGGNQLMIEFRGDGIPIPDAVSSDAALRIEWRGACLPENMRKDGWRNSLEWDLLSAGAENGRVWSKSYDLPLVEEIRFYSEKTGSRMDIIGPKPLLIRDISGMPGSTRQRLILECVAEAAPKMRDNVKQHKKDPLASDTPVTLELRDVPLREAFRILAELTGLNLILTDAVSNAPVVFSFKDTPLRDVFAYMLRMNGLSYSVDGRTLIIGTDGSIGDILGLNQTRQYKIAYADAEKLPALISSIAGLSRQPVLDLRQRSLYITATPSQHERIEHLIERLDNPGTQIMIEARLVEVNDGAKREIESTIAAIYKGWLFTYGATGMGSRYTYGNWPDAPNVSPTGSTESGEIPVPGGRDDAFLPGYVVDPAMKMLDAAFRAMESDNKGKVLASPSVVALDGQKASVRLTHNYLYQSGVDENGNPEFTNQETGPTLEITPSLGRDGFITIKMKIATGEIVTFRRSGNSEAPETTKREVDTQIRVRNGELFVIGGLYQENRTKSVTRAPVLGYIPFLGELFKSKSTQRTKSQMAFVAIPYILDIPSGTVEVVNITEAGHDGRF